MYRFSKQCLTKFLLIATLVDITSIPVSALELGELSAFSAAMSDNLCGWNLISKTCANTGCVELGGKCGRLVSYEEYTDEQGKQRIRRVDLEECECVLANQSTENVNSPDSIQVNM